MRDKVLAVVSRHVLLLQFEGFGARSQLIDVLLPTLDLYRGLRDVAKLRLNLTELRVRPRPTQARIRLAYAGGLQVYNCGLNVLLGLRDVQCQGELVFAFPNYSRIQDDRFL